MFAEDNWEVTCCDICNSSNFKNYIKPICYYKNLNVPSYIVKCDNCGLLFLNPRPKKEYISELYSRYYSSDYYKEDLHKENIFRQTFFLRQLWHWYNGQYLSEVIKKSKGNVLDIGCGTGKLLVELAKKGCVCYGIDINAECVDACKQKGFNVICGDIEQVDLKENFLDTVIMWHSIEHIYSPKKVFEKVNHFLKKGGTFFITSPNASSYLAYLLREYWYPWQIPFHLYHFTIDSIIKLAEQCNFKVKKIDSATPEYYLPQSIAIKANFSKNKIAKLLYKTKIHKSLIFRLAIAPIFRICDFLFLGKGECLKIELTK